MILRPATAADVPALTALARESFVDAFGHMYSPEDLSAFLSEYKSPAAVVAQVDDCDGALQLAEADGALLAFCKLSFSVSWPEHARGNRVGELKHLYAASSATGTGVGTALMDWAMGEFAVRGCDEVQLSVWSGNHGAQRFYARYGFEKVADVTFRVGEQIDEEYLFAKLL